MGKGEGEGTGLTSCELDDNVALVSPGVFSASTEIELERVGET